MQNTPRLITDDGQSMGAPEITIVPAIGAHIAALKANLRAEDEAEIVRFGITVQKALWYSYRNSLTRKTALIDGVVAACWGVHGVFMGNTGVPWLITTSEVRRISPLLFARIYQQEVLSMLKMFRKLENYVDPAYTSAVRLLEIIDFKVSDPEMLKGVSVRKFTRMA